MKILWFSTSSGDTHNIISSLEYLGRHEVKLVRYDAKWHEQSQQAMTSNAQVRDALQAGGWRVLGWPRERVAMDAEMIRAAEEFKPDIQIFTSAWEGLFCPENPTLAKLNSIAPMIHMLHDGSDSPWWEQLQQFEKDKCFDIQCNIDGGQNWPGGKEWLQTQTAVKGITLLTPVDPRPYGDDFISHAQRMYPLGYAGNSGGSIRSYVVQVVARAIPALVVHQRLETPDTYAQYAGMLKACRIVINVPFSGSNTAKHVKGRVVETGYAGACLMEWDNPATRGWFRPRHEYAEYGAGVGMWEGIEDLIEQAQFLIARPKMAEEIAFEHWKRVRAEHSPEVFWSTLFGSVKTREAEKAAEVILETASVAAD